jgi:hypothetical protein
MLMHNSTLGHMKFKKPRAISRFPNLQDIQNMTTTAVYLKIEAEGLQCKVK